MPDPTPTPALLQGPVLARHRIGLALAGIVLLYGIYGAVGISTAESGRPLHQLRTGVDAWVPFSPPAVLAYLWLFPQVLAPLAVVDDRRTLLRGALAYLMLVLAGLPFWLLFPVTVPRQPTPVVDLFTWGVAVTRWIDPPTNCFPSMHVAEGFFAAFIVYRCDKAVGRLGLVMAAFIWWSTMALGQHWFVDGLAGLIIAIGADALAFRWRPLPADALRAGPRRRLPWLLLLYAGLVALAGAPWWTGAVDVGKLARPLW